MHAYKRIYSLLSYSNRLSVTLYIDCGIRELYSTPIMFSILLRENLHINGGDV
jgi:hypothetical protein